MPIHRFQKGHKLSVGNKGGRPKRSDLAKKLYKIYGSGNGQINLKKKNIVRETRQSITFQVTKEEEIIFNLVNKLHSKGVKLKDYRETVDWFQNNIYGKLSDKLEVKAEVVKPLRFEVIGCQCAKEKEEGDGRN